MSSRRNMKRGATRSRRPSSLRDKRYWSASVTSRSNALDLDSRVFTWASPRRIALSLKRSAERSSRRKAAPYQSAMSMLTFYLNRAGRNLGAGRRRVLARAKVELRKVFGREGGGGAARPPARSAP